MTDRSNVEFTSVYEDDDFEISYDQFGPIKVMHSNVKRWTPSVAKRYKTVSDDIFKQLNEPLFVAAYEKQHSPTFYRFLRWLHFTPFGRGEYDNARCTFYCKLR